MRRRLSPSGLRDAFALFLLLTMLLVRAQDEGCAHVIDATAAQASDGKWTFSATVSSTETGWDKYANEWRVTAPENGAVLGTRILAHPHVTEQPFTRSLPGVVVPEDISFVAVASRDSVLGYCGDKFNLRLGGSDAPTTVAPSVGTATPQNETSNTTVHPGDSPTVATSFPTSVPQEELSNATLHLSDLPTITPSTPSPMIVDGQSADEPTASPADIATQSLAATPLIEASYGTVSFSPRTTVTGIVLLFLHAWSAARL